MENQLWYSIVLSLNLESIYLQSVQSIGETFWSKATHFGGKSPFYGNSRIVERERSRVVGPMARVGLFQ